MGVFSILLIASLMGVVTAPVSNMHSEPAQDAPVVSQAVFGTNIEILEEQDGFARIKTPDKYTGWISRSALHNLAADAMPYASQAAGVRIARVAGMFASLYREKSITRHQPAMTLPFDSRLEILGEEEDKRWYRVRMPDRSAQLWVQRGDISFDMGPIATSDMLTLSKRFLGLPYLWGGTSSYGFDCSGLTQMLVRQRGILMPRDAHEQAAWPGVSPVERADLEPGDLLFFGLSGQKITHTGMYLGAGEFVHATAHERPAVQISRVDEAHWAERLICARRVKLLRGAGE
jgi:gamma-D-glutamyl-L-lysine dipeptidyl-peptidase